jgi:large subunit ribosomal protein L13
MAGSDPDATPVWGPPPGGPDGDPLTTVFRDRGHFRDVYVHGNRGPRRPDGALARHRRQGPRARPRGDGGGAAPSRQAQTDLHAFLDTGDHVVVVNAASVKLTGRKDDQKVYRRHSGYEGGLREERARIVRQRRPERLVEEAVRGMLPKTKLGEAMYRKLKVYAGPDHPHAAQQPAKLEVA